MPYDEKAKSSSENFEMLLENIKGSTKTLKGSVDSKSEDLEKLNEDFVSKLSEQYSEQNSELNKEQLRLDESKKNLINKIKNIFHVCRQGIEFIVSYKKELEDFLKALNQQKNLLLFILISNLSICSYILVEKMYPLQIKWIFNHRKNIIVIPFTLIIFRSKKWNSKL
ncbi:MAG: hypothetical protein PHF18_14085 [Methanosarcina sp.]|uniref:hypothetical protein n=1 Tax=Methanosarcina sp. TaxID=2213 RepID=UPI002602809E|nr:hypothetical protein [Methanosarcina sp.]MDD3247956.1 hypothetical protein [Methanosarcina sp.]